MDSWAGAVAATVPEKAMVLAAGFGTRLRPLTLERPKPLVALGGRCMIDYGLDRLAAAGVAEAVVNIHYKGAMIRDHLQRRTRPRIVISDESDAVLETGGGVRRALPLLGEGPFFVLNSDMIWRDKGEDALLRLAACWDGALMDALLLVVDRGRAHGYCGAGDFHLCADGRLQRRKQDDQAPYVFTGVQILHPRLFSDTPEGAFSLNLLYDRAAAAGRLHGLALAGDWFDLGTPAALSAAERQLQGAG